MRPASPDVKRRALVACVDVDSLARDTMVMADLTLRVVSLEVLTIGSEWRRETLAVAKAYGTRQPGISNIRLYSGAHQPRALPLISQ
jgi:hypothetical protein